MPASAQSVSRRWTERHGEADVREDPAGGEGREPWAGYADAHDRVRAMLRPSPTDTHGIAWRDVERYWHLLDELREPVLTSRVRLDEATARALAPSLPHLADPRAATPADAWKRIQTWVTADAGEIPAGVRAYFERVLRLPPLAALLCVDGVERARDRRDDEATRVKVLLDLLGPPDWE
jgi:hypothetical protein